MPVAIVHQAHDLILRRVGFGRNQRNRQFVDVSGVDVIVDFDQWLRRTGVHHDKDGIGFPLRNPRKLFGKKGFFHQFEHTSAGNHFSGSDFYGVEMT